MTYSRHVRMPIVESRKFMHQVNQSRNLLLGIVTKDLLGQGLVVRLRMVLLNLEIHEALHAGVERRVGDCNIIRMPSAVEFVVVAGDTVVRILKYRVEVLFDACIVL